MTTSKLCEEQGLTLSQYRCLVRVMSGPVRASAMAEYMGISRPTLSSIVRNLERRGLVERVRADEDGRGVAVSATPKAIRAVAAVDRRMTEFVDELSRELGLQTFLELARGLEGPVDVVANGVRARSSMRSA
jgi:DNA-binding MarR family transcriptional regulator